MRAIGTWLSSGLAIVLACGAQAVRCEEPAVAAEAVRHEIVGQKIADFRLQDFQSQWHDTSELTGAKAIVVAFLGVECPLVQFYTPRLVELCNEYRDRGVEFLAVASNRQDSISELARFAETYKLNFPLLKDVGNEVADALAAERTPELFVIDAQRVVRFRGRVDDQYGFQTGVGYQRPSASRRDLACAIDEVLEGKAVSVATTHVPGCRIGRVRQPQPDAEVTYSNQIARVFQARCVECHRAGQIAPFALTDYQEVAGWAEMIEEVVDAQRMPPWHASPEYGHFANDSRLSDSEKELIHRWVAAGAPEGDPADLPAPREFTEGWRLPRTPDQVVYMNESGFEVPADGKVEYQYFVADPKFTEDKWISGAECLPGNRSVVHHIIVFVQEPGETNTQLADGTAASSLLAGTAPGNPPTVLDEGMAMRIPAGSKLVFQMHYTANGAKQLDRSAIGLVFADPQQVRREVKTEPAINVLFEIPAGAANHRVDSTRRIKEDTLLIALMPHMHLRGKAFRYDLVHANGKRETLLDIPRYDFNWQNSYYLEKPKLLPKGSKIHCVAHFDNSAENWANPDATQPVKWGHQTWEEMMIGWFVCAPDRDVDATQSHVADAATQPSQNGSAGQ